tara:strand:+ start:6655 stop:7878 length:1224 start_codon:yes stop_codon:yes gene_type:complete
LKSILIKVGVFPLNSETFIINNIILLDQLGYNIKVLCDKKLDFNKSIHKRQLQQLISEDCIIETRKERFSSSKIINWITFCFRNFKYLLDVFRLYRIVNDLTLSFEIIDFYKCFKKVDIIHIQYGTNCKPIDALKKINFIRSKIITTFHGHDVFFPINGIIHDPEYYKLLIEKGDLFFANTLFLKQKLLELGFNESKVSVIPVPVNTEFFKPLKQKKHAKNTSEIKLLCVGRLVEIKGFSYAIKAVRELKKRNIKFSLKIIGEGPIKDFLLSQIKRYNLNDSITILSAMSQDLLKFEYNQCDIFIMSSITINDEIKETQGLVTLEAQSCGTPVVAFDSGGIRYTFEDKVTGLLCREMDYIDMAEKLEFLINNPELRIKLGENAPIFVRKNYSEKVVKTLWKNILNEL